MNSKTVIFFYLINYDIERIIFNSSLKIIKKSI